jgi:hypothetical protein
MTDAPSDASLAGQPRLCLRLQLPHDPAGDGILPPLGFPPAPDDGGERDGHVKRQRRRWLTHPQGQCPLSTPTRSCSDGELTSPHLRSLLLASISGGRGRQTRSSRPRLPAQPAGPRRPRPREAPCLHPPCLRISSHLSRVSSSCRPAGAPRRPTARPPTGKTATRPFLLSPAAATKRNSRLTSSTSSLLPGLIPLPISSLSLSLSLHSTLADTHDPSHASPSFPSTPRPLRPSPFCT